MTKPDIIDTSKEYARISKKEATFVIATFFERMTNSLPRDDRVEAFRYTHEEHLAFSAAILARRELPMQYRSEI